MQTLNYDFIKNSLARSELIFKRGENLYHLGNYSLNESKTETDSYCYTFDGTQGTYNVSVSLRSNTVQTKCSCPFPYRGCKHAVAACLDILQRTKRQVVEQTLDSIQDFMTPEEVRQTAIQGRLDRAKKENLLLIQGDQYITTHIVQNSKGKQYYVTLYDPDQESGHCTCRDFATNHLDTCKHILFAYSQFRKDKDFEKDSAQEPLPFIHITWNSRLQKPFCRHGIPLDDDLSGSLQVLFNEHGVYKLASYQKLYKLYIAQSENPQFVFDTRLLDKIEESQNLKELEAIKRNYKEDFSFLKTELYRYQKEGVHFALFKKSAIIADEMGLGKTLQAISTAILKKTLLGHEKVLIVSPSSLKSQWKHEIEKFTDEKADIVEGPPNKREDIYFSGNALFKITNYEALLRDVALLKRFRPDFIILDEAQRIKNFETKTHKAVNSIPHSHSLIITGTPLENRLEDVYSIVQFASPTLLTPLWAFAAHHFKLGKNGKNKILGYKNLNIVQEKLKGLVLRRTKEEVFDELPDVLENNYYLDLSPKQEEIHAGLAQSLTYYSKKKILTPIDIKKIQQLLLGMRRVCDSTYLIDRETNISPKLHELASILKELVIQNKRKVIIFTEWTGMTFLIGKLLSDMGIKFVEYSGNVPVDKRQKLVDEFENNTECMVFLSTDAGGAGLNLQSADCVINFELPWNPAKLKQRIGRVNRIGQKSKSINVINLVCKHSIEEKVLAGINLKQDLFNAVFTYDAMDEVDFSQDKKNTFVNQIREMFGEDTILETNTQRKQFEIEEDTPHFLNPDLLKDKNEAEIDLTAEEYEEDKPSDKGLPEDGNPLFDHETLEAVLNQGMTFLDTLGKMATGSPLFDSDSKKAIEINKETGEVIMKFTLPKTRKV